MKNKLLYQSGEPPEKLSLKIIIYYLKTFLV